MITRGHAIEEPFYLRQLDSASQDERELERLQGQLTYVVGRIRVLSSGLSAINCLTHGDLVISPYVRSEVSELLARVLALEEDITQFHTYLSGRAAAFERKSARDRKRQQDMS